MYCRCDRKNQGGKEREKSLIVTVVRELNTLPFMTFIIPYCEFHLTSYQNFFKHYEKKFFKVF